MSDNHGKRKGGRGGGGGGESKKSKYFQTNKGATIPLGSRGFLVSCLGGKEFLAAREAMHLLTEYYEKLKPADAPAAPAVDDSEPVEADLSKQMEAEVADLKDNKNRLFWYHKTNVNGLLYISMNESYGGPGPVEIITAAAQDAKDTRQLKTRLCLRFLPATTTCYAGLEEIKAAAAKLLPAHFPTGPQIQFAVFYEHRASATLNRLAVINAIVDHIPQPPHKVNLDTPSKTVIVQLVKNCCAMSVVENFKDLGRFNLRELACAENKEGADADAKGASGSKAPEDAGGEEEKKGGGDGETLTPKKRKASEAAEPAGESGAVKKQAVAEGEAAVPSKFEVKGADVPEVEAKEVVEPKADAKGEAVAVKAAVTEEA